MTYPGILFWLIGLAAVASRGPAIYYLFFASWSFGTLAVIPPAALGGVSITPAWVSAALLCVHVYRRAGPAKLVAAATDPRRFGLLTLCTLYALVSGVLMPRLFQGQVDVILVKLLTVASPQPLVPSTSNFTQGFYFLLTTVTTVSLYTAASDPSQRRHLIAAFRLGGAMAILTGMADFVASSVGLSGLLEPFRNAAYVLMTDVEIFNTKRIIGLMSEASSYAALCMSFLGLMLFAPAADEPKLKDHLLKWGLCAGLVVATVASISSGGFVALAFLLLVLLAMTAVDLVRRRPSVLPAALFIATTAILVVSARLWFPDLFDAPERLIDLMVFQKKSSASYVERHMWNDVAFHAFLDTHGLGAGIGSARASSWIYAVLSNIGLPGALMLFGTILLVVAAPARGLDPFDWRLQRAAKWALAPTLFIASLSDTAVNYGVGGAWLIALASALCWSRARRGRRLGWAMQQARPADPRHPVGPIDWAEVPGVR